MKIYSTGKNIPSYPFTGLFTQGEKLADTITFLLERFYCGHDMSECSFVMRGINENNEEAQQPLLPQTEGDYVRLDWNVSEYFTACAGSLELELRAFRESDGETELIMIYTLSPITVNKSHECENLPLPDTAQQSVNLIAQASAQAAEELNSLMEEFSLDEVNSRLDAMEAANAEYLARPEVIPVTQSEYDALTPKENALYVIIS